MAKVRNNLKNIRGLLTDIYVAVLAQLPSDTVEGVEHGISDRAFQILADTILDAAEGRDFEPLKLPWPPVGNKNET
jgi:hypothetical protein